MLQDAAERFVFAVTNGPPVDRRHWWRRFNAVTVLLLHAGFCARPTCLPNEHGWWPRRCRGRDRDEATNWLSDVSFVARRLALRSVDEAVAYVERRADCRARHAWVDALDTIEALLRDDFLPPAGAPSHTRRARPDSGRPPATLPASSQGSGPWWSSGRPLGAR